MAKIRLNRRRLYEILEIAEEGDQWSKVFDFAMITLIVLNVAAVIIETLPSIKHNYAQEFLVFDYLSACIFAIEYGFRVWSSVESPQFSQEWSNRKKRIKYILSPMAIIDLLAFLPSLLQMFINIDLRFLRIFRMLRIFKLTRYSGSMELILKVMQKERSAFFAAFFVLIMLMIVAASGMYQVEHHAQPEAFASIPHAMWWALVTLTTVGYGDVYPITPLGQLFGGLIIIGGVGLVALPAGIMASAFGEEMRRRRKTMNSDIHEALLDGFIDDKEMQQLQKSAQMLGLEEQEMQDLIQLALQAHSKTSHADGSGTAGYHYCPHCGKKIR